MRHYSSKIHLVTIRPEVTLVHVPLRSHVFVINPSGITTDNTYDDYVTPTSHLEFLSLHAFQPSRVWAVYQVWTRLVNAEHVRRTEHKSRPCKAADSHQSQFAPYSYGEYFISFGKEHQIKF